MTKKQYIHSAMKEWDSNDSHDTEQKNRISWLIKKNHLHHFPLLDETIFINRTDFRWTRTHPKGFSSKEDLFRQWHPFKPDMLFPLKNLIIEIDGTFHTNTSKGIKQTKLRNQYYEYAGIRCLVLDSNIIKKLSNDEMLKLLKPYL